MLVLRLVYIYHIHFQFKYNLILTSSLEFFLPLSQVGRRFASGTPLSVLDPVGSTTIEQAYKNIDEKLKVCTSPLSTSIHTLTNVLTFFFYFISPYIRASEKC